MTAIVVLVGAIGLGLVGAWPAGALIEPQTTITIGAARARPIRPRRASRSSRTSWARRSSASSTAAAGRGAPRLAAYSSLPDGEHTFEVRATDEVPPATTDPTPATHTWTIDTTAPDATITNGPSEPDRLDRRDLRVLLVGPERDLRVPARRRRLLGLHQPQDLQRAVAGLAHLPGARDRRRREHRHRRLGHLDDRHDRAHGHDHQRPAEPDRARPSASFSFTSNDAGATLRVPARRRRLLGLHDSRDLPEPVGDDAHLPGAGDRRRRQHRRSRLLHVDDRHHRADGDDHQQPAEPVGSDERELLLHLQRGRQQLRVPARRRRILGLHEPQDLQRPRGRRRTPSRCAQPTAPATPAPRTPTPGRSTPRRRQPRSPAARPTRPPRRRQLLVHRRRRDATFECKLDGAAFSACTDPSDLPEPRGRQPHLPGARHRRRRQHRAGRHPHLDDRHDRAHRHDHQHAAEPLGLDRARASRSPRTTPAPRFECQLDGGGFSACTSPRDLQRARGDQRTPSRCAPTTASATRARRTRSPGRSTPPRPTVTITNGPPNPTALDRAPASRSLHRTRARTFECQLDGGGFAACTSPRAYSSLVGGHAHLPGAGHGQRRQRLRPGHRTPGRSTTRRRPSRSRARLRPLGLDQRQLLLLRQRGGRDLRVQARRRRLLGLHRPGGLPGLAAGSHTFQVRATDGAGNTARPTPHLDDRHDRAHRHDHQHAARPLGLDRAPASRSPSNDAGATFECQLDGGGFTACTCPANYSGLAATTPHLPGAREGQRRQHRPPTRYTWTIDTTAPT